MKKRWIGVILIAGLLFPAACRWGGEKTRPAPQRKKAETKKEKPDLPMEFARMESQALELFRLPNGQWGKAEATVAGLGGDWLTLKKKLEREKVKKDAFKTVDLHLNGANKAVRERNLFKVKEHANEVIGGLQPLKTKYKNAIPPEVVQIETTLRELELHIAQGNWTIAEGIAKAAPKQWEKLKPTVEKTGAKEVGKNAEGSFKELKTAIKEKNSEKAQQMIGMIQSDMADLRNALNKGKNE